MAPYACRECGEQIEAGSSSCVHCGVRDPLATPKTSLAVWIGGAAPVILIIVASIVGFQLAPGPHIDFFGSGQRDNPHLSTTTETPPKVDPLFENPRPMNEASNAPRANQAATSSVRKPYREVALLDFKVDKHSLVGQRIVTSGHFAMIGDQGILGGEMVDMSPIVVDISHLRREDRKTLFDCGALGCNARIYGRVAPLVFDIGIQAEAVEID